MKLSVVVSAYNEEKNIENCLESVKGWTDEIIVVNNSSEDRTAEHASKFTKKLYTQKNDPHKIDVQKNFGFSKATGDWILSLDADESLTDELKKEINSVLESGSADIKGYWIPRKNIIFKKWIKSDMWWPDYQLKLFARGKGGFNKNLVHKALTVEGQTEKLENFLIHNNYETVSQYITKLNNYTDIEAETMISQSYSFNWLDAIRFPIDDFVKTFFLQKGYKDGLHGLVLSTLQAFYAEVVFAKIWEKQGFREIEGENFAAEVKREFNNSATKIKYWFTTFLIHNSRNPIKKALLKVSRKLASSKVKST